MEAMRSLCRKDVVYAENQLDRKMRRERSKLPVLSEDTPSDEFCRCVGRQHVSALLRTAKLTPLERKVFMLGLHGASLSQTANLLGISRQRMCYTAACLKKKMQIAARDKYYGLHEVYWREVRRYVYRKPAHGSCTRRISDE